MTTSLNKVLGHGMGTALEDKDWAHISNLELHALQHFYAVLKGEIDVVWRSPRPFSSALLVHVTAERAAEKNALLSQRSYFIKRSHRSFRTASDILQEHAFIQHLASKGIPVAVLIASDQGITALELGDWTYEIHEKAPGLDLYANQHSWKPFFYAEHAAKAGALLAQLHMAMQDFPEQQGRSAPYLVSNQALLVSEDIVAAIHARIQKSQALTDYFSDKELDSHFLEQVSQVHQHIKKTVQQAPKIWTHNDLHASNLLWSEQSSAAEVSTVFDFGLADRNSAIYDLAVAIERNFIDWLALEHADNIHVDEVGLAEFLRAYFADTHPQDDFSILPELLKIVHLDFAFSELEYFVGITGNLKHADAAYYDWLIGHTRWFFSEQGQQFTQTLTRLIVQGVQHEQT